MWNTSVTSQFPYLISSLERQLGVWTSHWVIKGNPCLRPASASAPCAHHQCPFDASVAVLCKARRPLHSWAAKPWSPNKNKNTTIKNDKQYIYEISSFQFFIMLKSIHEHARTTISYVIVSKSLSQLWVWKSTVNRRTLVQLWCSKCFAKMGPESQRMGVSEGTAIDTRCVGPSQKWSPGSNSYRNGLLWSSYGLSHTV